MSTFHSQQRTAQTMGVTEKENLAERNRLRNVEAQRRYRERKRSRLAYLEAKVETINYRYPFCTSASSDPTSTTSLAQNTDDSDAISWSTGEFASNHSPASNAGLELFREIDSTYKFYLDSGVSVPLSTTGDDWLERSAGIRACAQSPIPAVECTPFADYLITTPGLSCIRAKMEIFQAMHGAGYQLDIWSPSASSPFTVAGNSTDDEMANSINQLPQDFHPTALQRTVPHHPALDALPWPSFRDKFLYILTLPDKYRPAVARGELHTVMMQLIAAMKDAGGGLRIWGCNPFDKDAWEIGPVFYSKFWWAIDVSVVEQSNRLRLNRGEDILKVNMQEL